ncbi:MAG TPA: large-conductance mechanosensitive channel protein MscL [Luteibaculaceae bacterium]|nr:large-conductance mechanosensitive channel protein MscL [Luteibaculaceae bacterium]
MGLISEFKEFAMKGNVVDLAVGIIIGAEFGKIVNSLVNDVIMPPIGFLIGGVNFTDLKLVIQTADASVGGKEVAIGYGSFIQSVFNFIIIAASVFFMIKAMNALRKEPAKE